jgi:hypothetical protein
MSTKVLAKDLQHAIHYTKTRTTAQRQKHRREVIKFFRERAEKREKVIPENAGLNAAQKKISGRLHAELVGEICDCLGIGGEDYVRRLRVGWPVVGVSDESGVWKYKDGNSRHVTRPIQSKRELLAQRSRLIKEFEEIAQRQPAAEKELVWSSFIQECEAGTLEGFFPLEDTHRLPEEFLPLRRFVIEKMTSKLIDGEYKEVLKRRPCDN